MKKTMTRKIIASYLIIIFITLLFVGAIFSLSVKRYMENQARTSLMKDAASIADFLKKDAADDEASENRIKQLLKDRIALRKGMNTVESNWAVVSREQKVLFPKNKEEAEAFTTKIQPLIKDKMGRKMNDRAEFELEGAEYMAVILPLTAEARQIVRGWVVLYTPVGPVDQMSRSILYVLLISLLFTGGVAVIFGVIFARSIARPVIALKKRAERLSKRDFDSRVEIKTGDELEELADTIDKMAVELKEYDMAQKRFLQNASHELKTPLMSIQGYAEGIKDGVFEDNEKALQVIAEESTRLKGIVDELIFLSKLETMEDFYRFNSESINEVIEKGVEKVKSLALKSGITISTILYKDASIKMDRDKLIQAIINVIGNCLRYAESEVTVTTENDGKCLVIVIRDDGEGFEEKEIANVFKRFYKGRKGNTGLGLAITMVIVERHGGTIEASNGTSGGAEFRIKLPVQYGGNL